MIIMVEDKIKTPKLKVAEALSQRDIGQGIVRRMLFFPCFVCRFVRK